jgi:hypothetical protein
MSDVVHEGVLVKTHTKHFQEFLFRDHKPFELLLLFDCTFRDFF